MLLTILDRMSPSHSCWTVLLLINIHQARNRSWIEARAWISQTGWTKWLEQQNFEEKMHLKHMPKVRGARLQRWTRMFVFIRIYHQMASNMKHEITTSSLFSSGAVPSSITLVSLLIYPSPSTLPRLSGYSQDSSSVIHTDRARPFTSSPRPPQQLALNLEQS